MFKVSQKARKKGQQNFFTQLGSLLPHFLPLDVTCSECPSIEKKGNEQGYKSICIKTGQTLIG
jgi:hypothetical protein